MEPAHVQPARPTTFAAANTVGGSDVEHQERLTELRRAIVRGYSDLVLVQLTRYGDLVNCVDKRGRAPLHWAVKFERHSVTILLLNRFNADPNVRVQGNDGRTPMHFAAASRTMQAMNDLMNATTPADPNILDDDRAHAIHWAASRGNLEAVERLIEIAGADIVHAVDAHKRTPLYWASMNGHCGIIRVLVEKYQVSVNATDDLGRTPLHDTVQAKISGNIDRTDGNIRSQLRSQSGRSAEDRIEATRLLVALGADVTLRDNRGRSPRDLAGNSSTLMSIIGTWRGRCGGLSRSAVR